MRIGLLGPFIVNSDDRPLGVGKGNERALLALLALHANEPLSTDRIVDALWGERPPATARDMVRLYVSRARRHLGDHLLTDAAGYVLRAAVAEIDLTDFYELRRAGNAALAAGDLEAAAASLQGALACWRGEPLAEFADLPFAHGAIPRLEELRLAAAEDHYDAQLALGGAAEAIPELEQLVEQNPFRERLRGQLMLALYRAGRQADALTRYRDGRRLMVDEVGIEPGPQLRELERAILEQDPALVPPLRRNQPAQATPQEPEKSRRSKRAIATAIVLAGVTSMAVVAAVFAASRGSAPLNALPPDSLGLVDAKSSKLSAAVRLPGVPVDLVGGARSLWVALGEPHEIVEVDPATKSISKSLRVAAVPRRLASTPGSIWIDNSYDGTVSRISEASDVLGKPRRLFPTTRISFAGGPGFLWAASSQTAEAVKLNPRDGAIARAVRRLDAPIAIATGFDALWAASSTRAEIQRVSRQSVTRIAIGTLPADVAAGSGAVWAVTPADGKLWQINPRERAVVGIVPVAPDPEFVATMDGSVWVGSHRTGVLTQVDPTTDKAVSTLNVGRPISGLRVYRGQLWVAVA